MSPFESPSVSMTQCPSNLSTVMCIALSRCPHISIAIGSPSLMTSLTSRQFTCWSKSLRPLLHLFKGLGWEYHWGKTGHPEGWQGWRVHVQGVWGILHWAWHPEAAHCQESPSAEWCCREEQQDNGRGFVSTLYESGMPTAFWGEALATFIHASNKLFTSALPDSIIGHNSQIHL